MIILLIILYALGLALLGREVLAWLYIAQLKEYRLDRVREYLSSPEGKRLLIKQVLWLLLWIGMLIISFQGNIRTERNEINDLLRIIPTAIFAIFILIGTVTSFSQLSSKKVKIPKPTSRAIATAAAALLLFLAVIMITWEQAILNLETTIIGLIALTPVFIAFATAISYPISYLLKKRIINAATQKRASMKNLLVIGVTGSYGKTSVKEYLYTVLNGSFNVLKTEDHVNTEIGVATTVNNHLTSEHQIFIVEMGAYRSGEIEAICNIVKPKTGIITGVNNQHIALFGSIQNIVEAKSELVEALPENGKIILNKDNKWCRAIGEKFDKKNRWYSLGKDADIGIQKSKITPQKTLFTVLYKNSKFPFVTKQIGEHVIQNALPAILIAFELGIPYQTLSKRVAKLKPIAENMQKIEKKGMTIIKNTYNLNVESIKSAQKISDVFEFHQKILVLDDILELGKEAEKTHSELVQYLQTYDKIFLIGKNFSGVVKKALEQSANKNIQITISKDSGKISKSINEQQVQKVVILLGRSARNIAAKLS